ncbi:hypothetical protein JVT61DRAFT_4297 [Boletus reticuloceps]|uniref:Uncharacterized protein n=1 Tax=Boletus reticuloceps TaxID=495285 RepID=A0A8I2YLD4_9AGAM|nr:hypothetical protein JVT61DRAFT_4297 [Boletus reticuloceps]
MPQHEDGSGPAKKKQKFKSKEFVDMDKEDDKQVDHSENLTAASKNDVSMAPAHVDPSGAGNGGSAGAVQGKKHGPKDKSSACVMDKDGTQAGPSECTSLKGLENSPEALEALASASEVNLRGSRDFLEEELGRMGSGKCLEGKSELGHVFKAVPFWNLPALVIEIELVDKKEPTKWSPSVFLSTPREDPIARAQDEFLSGYQKKSPSSGGIPSTFSDEETIPTMLLHPVLGQFANDCHEFKFRAEDHLLAGDLEIAMSNFYTDETARVEGVSKVLEKHKIHLNFLLKILNSRFVVDADMSVDKYRYVIAEFKNEAGSTPAEPFLEAIAYYVESTRELALKIPRSPLPCLLLAIYGPHIVFAGATWNRRPVVQVLSMLVAFHIHHMDDQNQLTVARHMAAFHRASEALRTYYKQIGEIPIPLSTCPPATK